MARGKSRGKTEGAVEAYRQLRRAAETLGRHLERQLGLFGVTPGEFRVLEAIYLRGPLRQDKLAKETYIDPDTLRFLTTSLAKLTLVVKRQDEEDKRQSMIHLTPQGRAVVTKVFPRQAKLIRAQMIAISGREQDMLKRLCEKLAEGDVRRLLREISMED